MNTIFAANLKRFRLAKSYTQEQVADKLGVTAQSVSRWECGTTLPDIMLLPAIAELYSVTVDDLYKSTSVAKTSCAPNRSSESCSAADSILLMICAHTVLFIII